MAGADADTLQSLIEKSLVRHSSGRYWMLETIREYAAERLADSDERERLEQAHAEWCLETVDGHDFEESVRRAWSEFHNVRKATAWAAQNGGDLALRLALELPKALSVRGSLDEARVCIERALDTAETSPAELRAEALHEAAGIALR